MKADPTPEVFDPRDYGRRRSCLLCDSHSEIVAWLAESLSITFKANFPRPSILYISRQANKAFKVHHSRSLLERHLKEHEPNWNLWDASASP